LGGAVGEHVCQMVQSGRPAPTERTRIDASAA
jgi:hypothetical protein